MAPRWVLGSLLLCTAAAHPAEYRLPLLPAAPAVDGAIGEDEWTGALWIDGFAWQGALERRTATGIIGATATHLYLAIRSQLPAEGELTTEVDRDTENLVFDDSIEVWIDPTLGQASGHRLQMLANAAGHRWYKMHAYGGLPDDPGWRGGWDVACTTHDGVWDCEIGIPIEQIAPGRTATDGVWGINLCRNWKNPWAFSCLSGVEYKPTDVFSFTTDPAPAIRLLQRGVYFAGDVKPALVVTNPSARPLDLAASLVLGRDLMPELKQSEALHLAPGESRTLSIEAADVSTKRFELVARVGADGGPAFLDRTVSWPATGPWVWSVAKAVVPPVDFQFAYYPYGNTMRILADVSNLPADAVLGELTGVVRTKTGEVVYTFGFDALKNGRQELAFGLPPLEGEYEIALKATGENVPADEVVRPFRRTRFEWEHTPLGRSTTVYPPFEPIRVDGHDVRTVLRKHVMGDSGLWDQVEAKGAPLLAAPMRWEARVGGEHAPVTAGPLTFAEVADNQAVARTSITAGALQGDVGCTWDYDGLMRVDLTLAPSAGQSVDGLQLVIPVDQSQATHLHAMGDGIRNTLYERVPEGEGVVWTAERVQANDIPPRFCSYIYVGTPVRGLCWFAENDRGWGWDPSTPNLELVRQDGQVQLRVHLINRPLVIDAPRTITFGLLAAPVKPRLAPDWRHKFRRDGYSILGTDINWLALGDCGSVYPAGRDLYLWEMIARGNRERLSEADVQAVIDRGRPYFEPYGEERVKTFEAHARYNLTSRYGTRMIFYYNRASYQLAEEFQTFQDEWCLSNYRTVGEGNGIGEIKIVPSESYIDHALYWYDKSFDIGGNQGVYWDNWFFAGSYNTHETAAYTRSDGTVVPSTGVWGLRELSKRTFQLMNERGMLPITMPHMTSTNILPLHSFATVQYDWEWKYSEGDVQGRFPRDYILLVSNGELAGTWPVLLNDHGAQAEDPWTARTFAAVAMVHELDCPYPAWSEAGRQQLALFAPVDEILARPGVDAYRYWDERPQPMSTDDPDLPAIVYVVPGEEAVCAVVSYADEDRAARVRIDTAALGMPGGCIVTDAETGAELAQSTGGLVLPLKRHDVRVLRVVSR